MGKFYSKTGKILVCASLVTVMLACASCGSEDEVEIVVPTYAPTLPVIEPDQTGEPSSPQTTDTASAEATPGHSTATGAPTATATAQGGSSKATQAPDKKTPEPTGKPDDPTLIDNPDGSEPLSTTSSYDIVGSVPQCARVPSSYFDDVVFIGDSVSEKLKSYEGAKNVLGEAEFLTAVSFSAANALKDVSEKSKHPSYNGKKMKLEAAVPLTGKHKVYIMLGINDLSSTGGNIEKSLSRMEEVCDNILAKADVSIYVQSVTPLADKSNVKTVDNAMIFLYNQKLCSMCRRRGWNFVNVSSVMYNKQGYLKSEYCADNKSDGSGMGLHFSSAGCAAWVDYLYTHAI